MKLRTKLISPLVLLIVMLLGIMHFYIFPQVHTHLEKNFDQTEQLLLEAIATTLVSPLLTQDVAQIHEIMAEQKERNPRWISLKLYDQAHSRIYPLTDENHPQENYGHAFKYSISYDSAIIGTIELLSDSSRTVHKLESTIHSYAYVFLSLILLATAVVGWLQNSFVTKPVIKLADATKFISNGNYDFTHSSRGNDEIAQLTDSFCQMSKNIRKQELALKKEATHIQRIVDNVFNAIITADIDGTILTCNTSTENIFGYQREELIGKNLNLLMDNELAKSHSDYMKKYLLSGAGNVVGISREVRGIHKDGHEIFLELAISYILADDKHLFIGVLQDISQRKMIEQELTTQRKLMESINNAQNLFISIGDPILFFSSILPDLLEISGAEYGLIGEVFQRESQPSFVQAYAIANQRWDDLTSALCKKQIRGGLIIDQQDNPVLAVINKHEVQISNEHTPADEILNLSEIKNYLTIPIFLDMQVVGVIFFANRQGGFDQSTTELIRPALHACAQTLDAVEKNRIRDKNKYELEIARDEAEAAARAKSNFLATMSHEIRTPMNGVLGMLQLLANTELDDKQKQYINTATGSSELLLTVINDILDYSKIEAGKLELENIPFSPYTVIEETTALLARIAHEKGIELISALQPNLPELMAGDPTRLRQIITNLINNAIKFTEHGHVALYADYSSGNLNISVVDTGIGIADSQQLRLFRSFSQLDNSHTRKYGGTGLGLVICKKLVELMGGRLRVNSEPEFGSEFYFSVPMNKVQDNEINLNILSTIRDKRILLVDDIPTNLAVLKGTLGSWGISKITTAQSGFTALAKINDSLSQQQPFDLVILDMQMPGMDGIELAGRIRQLNNMRDTKIILLSSVMDTPSYNIINSHISKPIRQSALLNTLSILFNNRKYETAKFHSGNDNVDNSFNGYRLLLVEDNRVNQIVAQGALEHFGFTVDICENGKEAVKQVQEIEYDLVLMDIQMPVMDGLEATRLIRKLGPSYQNLPIIAMTAHALTGDKEVSLSAGMNDHMTKPIETDKILITLSSWLPDKRDHTGTAAELLTNLTRFEYLLDHDLDSAQELLERLLGEYKGSQWHIEIDEMLHALVNFNIEHLRDLLLATINKSKADNDPLSKSRKYDI